MCDWKHQACVQGPLHNDIPLRLLNSGAGWISTLSICIMDMYFKGGDPADTCRKYNVIITTKLRRVEVIMALLLHHAISLNFVLKGPIDKIPALVQIMAWRRPGDKPLSEPVVVSLLTHIRVTRPQ